MRIVLPGLECLHELSDHEQRGIARIVVDVFQSQLRDLRSAVIEQHGVIAIVFEHLAEDPEMEGEHGGDQDGVGGFHFAGERYVILFHIWVILLIALYCGTLSRAYYF